MDFVDNLIHSSKRVSDLKLSNIKVFKKWPQKRKKCDSDQMHIFDFSAEKYSQKNFRKILRFSNFSLDFSAEMAFPTEKSAKMVFFLKFLDFEKMSKIQKWRSKK